MVSSASTDTIGNSKPIMFVYDLITKGSQSGQYVTDGVVDGTVGCPWGGHGGIP